MVRATPSFSTRNTKNASFGTRAVRTQAYCLLSNKVRLQLFFVVLVLVCLFVYVCMCACICVRVFVCMY